MRDAKGLHEEILKRERYDFRDGWGSGTHAFYWMLWGGCIILATWFLVTGS